MLLQRDPEQTEVRYLQSFADLKDARILEVGCGDGRLTWRYAQYCRHVMAIDPEPVRLQNALKACPQTLDNTTTFLCSDSQELPFAAQAFDSVILAWSL